MDFIAQQNVSNYELSDVAYTETMHESVFFQSASARKIQNFLRKSIAAQMYGSMFFGDIYKKDNELYITKNTSSIDVSFFAKPLNLKDPSLIKTEFGYLQETDGKLFRKTKFPLKVLDIAEDISKMYLKKMRKNIFPLNKHEKKLYNKIMPINLLFRHQTVSDKIENPAKTKATLYSHNILKNNGGLTLATKTTKGDEDLGNTNNVFFAVEFHNNKTKGSLEQLVGGVTDYGCYQYSFFADENNHLLKYGYLTLLDQGDNQKMRYFYQKTPPFAKTEQEKEITDALENIICMYYEEQKEQAEQEEQKKITDALKCIIRIFHKKQKKPKQGCFNTEGQQVVYVYKHMHEAIALNLIYFLRFLKKYSRLSPQDATENKQIAEFINYVMDPTLSYENLSSVINFMSTPEFHVPRILSTYNYAKHQFRDMTLTEAVKSENFQVMSKLLKNNDLLIKKARNIFRNDDLYDEGALSIIYMFVLRYIVEPNNELSEKPLSVVLDDLYSILDNKKNEVQCNIKKRNLNKFKKALKKLKKSIMNRPSYRNTLQHFVYKDNISVLTVLLKLKFFNDKDVENHLTLDIPAENLASYALHYYPEAYNLLKEHKIDLTEYKKIEFCVTNKITNLDKLDKLMFNEKSNIFNEDFECWAMQWAFEKNNEIIINHILERWLVNKTKEQREKCAFKINAIMGKSNDSMLFISSSIVEHGNISLLEKCLEIGFIDLKKDIKVSWRPNTYDCICYHQKGMIKAQMIDIVKRYS